jgi:sec-independent protein translocase protein TatB
MLEIGFPELILIAIVGLLVIGPERLPETLRTLGLWFGRMRRSFTAVKAEIEKEIGMDEVKRQLHNEAIMEEMKRIEAEVKNTADTANTSINQGIQAATPPPSGSNSLGANASETPSIDPNVDGEISDLIAAQDGGPSPSAPADERDHTDAGADDDRDQTDAGEDDVREQTDVTEDTASDDDRDHSDAGAEPEDKTTAQRVTNG